MVVQSGPWAPELVGYQFVGTRLRISGVGQPMPPRNDHDQAHGIMTRAFVSAEPLSLKLSME
jgi:hypothetical protein